MFVNPTLPYFGLRPDCADVIYTLRAIFAYENKLPFVIHNPSFANNKIPTLNNRQNRWDSYKPGITRFKAMIKDITSRVGTNDLSYYDSYPIALKSINAGSFFMSQLVVSNGQYVQHTMNIKKINDVGTFDVLFSSESISAENEPLQRRKENDFDILPVYDFGFKRFRWPEHIGKKISEISPELSPSIEQYPLALKLGKEKFFKLVKKILASEEETSTQRLRRNIKSICLDAQARISSVNAALKYATEIKYRCMDFKEYDIYSTPARDSALREGFLSLQKAYFEIKDQGDLDSVDPKIVEFSENILLGREKIADDLKSFCPINYKTGTTIDLAMLWQRIYFNKISSHPNDLINIRWGEQVEPKTQCKLWYWF